MVATFIMKRPAAAALTTRIELRSKSYKRH